MMLMILAVGLAVVGNPEARRAGPPFPRIANCYSVQLTPSSSDADLRAIARYGLLIGGVWANWADPASVAGLRAKMDAVRRLNPQITILDFSCSAPYADPNDGSVPADGWLLQCDGKPVDGWPGTRMVDLTKPSVIDYMVRCAVRSVRERGFDGAFIDCMSSGFDSWAVNIASGTPYTIDTNRDGKPDEPGELNRLWTKAKAKIADRVRAELGPKAPFMTNQAGDWGLRTMNGILLEDYLDYVLTGTMTWDGVMANYLRWTARGLRPTLTTIVSSSGIEPPFDAWTSMREADRNSLLERGKALTPRMRFGLATTLMGDGYFAYDLHTRWRGQRWWYPEYDAKLGYPRGAARRRADGAWQRDFDGGTVIVNPGEMDVIVQARKPLRDASTGRAGTRHVIAGLDGRILTPAARSDPGDDQPTDTPFTLRGPERMVLRNEKALLRVGGSAVIADANGRITQVTDGRRSLISGMSAFIVSRPWRDYVYSGFERTVGADGSLRFVGERVDGAARVRQEQTVRTRADGFDVEYRWTALTPATFVMFRHQTDLPTVTYGGGRLLVGNADISLPAAKAPKPQIAEANDGLRAMPTKGPAVGISASRRISVVDERDYGVAAFRAGAHPAPSEVKRGDTWSLNVRISLEQARTSRPALPSGRR